VGRFLVVTPPVIGHLFPTIAVGRELADRGHEVAWAGHAAEVGKRLPPWAPFIPVAEGMPPEVQEAIEHATSKAKGGLAAFIGVWRDFVAPVSRQMMPGVLDAIDTFRPDVLIADQQAPAAAVAAELRGVRWATSATTPVELVSYWGEQQVHRAPEWLDPATISYLHKVRDWLRGLLCGLLVDLGMDAERAETFDPRYSHDLVVAYTTLQMLGLGDAFPERFALVGPSLGDRPAAVEFPWEWLDGKRPLVYVSLGTINWRGGERFFAVAVEALREMDVQAVLVAPDGLDVDVPDNVLVRDRVPQLELLDRVDAVVSHGGHNTVIETLNVGRPLVLAPIRDDQPIIAEQVTRAGAGLTVRFLRVTPDSLREAIGRVLTEQSFRDAAERVRASFAAAGGPVEAADRLEALLPSHPSSPVQ
jgi:MGT family glycosyltransferase